MSLFRRLRRLVEAELGDRLAPDDPLGDDPIGNDPLDDDAFDADPSARASDPHARASDPAAAAAREGSSAPGSALPPDVVRAYRALELPPGAPFADVKRAYRRQMKRYHEDRFANDAARRATASEVSKRLNAAYARLKEHLR